MEMSPKRKRSSSTTAIEPLEARSLPSATSIGVTAQNFLDAEPNDTADRAQNLGAAAAIEVAGSIDRLGVDVDWYTFTLDVPSSVNLAISKGTLSLFNDASGDFSDPLTFGSLRLLQQQTAADADGVTIQRDLAAGTYRVAVSAAGNRYFQPFVADSGLPGVGGAYVLTIASTPRAADPGNSDSLLNITATPLTVRLSLAAALPYVPTVELLDANGDAVGVAFSHQNVGLSEVQVIPSAPLAPGHYTAVLKDALGNVQLTEDFEVALAVGGETGVAGNDTPATAIDLGTIGDTGLIQVAGTIGDDPFYQLVSPDLANYAGNDVDLYHFQITSTEVVGLQAEVFAGRIGSPLDAGISLYRLDSATGNLVFVVGLNQSYNLTSGTDVPIPFYYDPAITAGLTAGDYFLAVSHGSNTTSPLERQLPGSAEGRFAPTQPHSGQAGTSIGNYVLNLQVVPIPDPPEVTSASITEQQTLTSSPTELHVSFSEYINLTALAFEAFQRTSESTVAGVFIQGEHGDKYFPRLTAFDPDDLEAHLLVLDRLPPGDYELHFSGRLGLTNVVGAPLVGNSPNGDYVVKFSVDTTDAGTAGNPLVWTHEFETEPTTAPQQLGVLFPHELESGVEIVRSSTHDQKHAKDNGDSYQFTILQEQSYFFTLGGDGLPRNTTLSLFDVAGNAISGIVAADGRSLTTQLAVGEYVLHVGDWGGAAARSLDYQVGVFMQGNSDNAPQLWSGPAPAIGTRLSAPASVPPTTLPGSGSQPGGNPGLPRGTPSGGSPVSDSGATLTTSTTTTSRTSYFNDRSGLSLINLPDASGNFVIAIPTIGSSANGGAILRANRATNQRLSDLAGVAPGGLSGLADGLVGKSGSAERVRDRKLTAGRKLGDLVDSALAATKDETKEETHVAGENKPKPPPADDVDEDVVSVDAEKGEGGTVGATEAPAEESGDKARPRNLTELQNRRLLEILSLGLPENQAVTVVAVDSTELASTLKEIDLPRALKYSDKVFAGGLGLLLSALATQRSSDSELIRSVHRKGTRAEGRSCPSRREGSVS